MHSKPTQAAATEDGKCEKGHAYDADVPSQSNSHPLGLGVLWQSHDMSGGVQHLVCVKHSQDQTHDDTYALQAGGIKVRLDTDSQKSVPWSICSIQPLKSTFENVCLAKLWQPCSEKHSLL